MINYQELEQALKTMNNRSKLFLLVKVEMQARGHWKYRPRGKGFDKGIDDRRNTFV